ncbi:divalent cation transporter [Methanosarcina sp. 2.H.T.1A.6]|uniref:magnesium transporter n=1 Tax=unclassified Methanosarcina TaxID=2644672 RepID=UPI000620F9E7|nr:MULTISPECIES: magnesium transporter [unclassified Methanosarcina]KKG09790.1 divalent cation transporter [Methanosarcina sp. 2.H.T.1A.15]KKG12375.1 divalent cation transporter [Methanosarcina sp. 2.H.A.1B.4]KKG18482.1 divalent cation transporter [Methanosarcina sp. 2.H.T.1A.3]KKG20683.1 divalent cation transporter [Methanosarcina sp. 2.H.T.1A.6]KKG23243.1 divalent cation transporter [Methanosarcina sp. 2.H.T.1A.8]
MPPESHRDEDIFESQFRDKYLSEYASVSSIVREALPFELMATVGGVIAGVIFSGMTSELEMIPGLIVIYPGVLGLRGNISSTLGSRLGSAIHMGLITDIDRNNPELTNNISGSLLLGFFMAILLGFLGHFVTLALGFESAGAFKLILICVISALTSGVILSFVAVLLAIGMFRFGFDPDNVVTPSIATIGDIVSMFMLFLSAKLVVML